MSYLSIKFLGLVFGINKVLADAIPGGGATTGGADGDGFKYKLPNPLGTTSTFAEIIDRIVGYLIIIAAPIVTLMILIAAFKILTAGDNPENLKGAKQTIFWTVIGYAIILLSKGITLIIKQLLGS